VRRAGNYDGHYPLHGAPLTHSVQLRPAASRRIINAAAAAE